MDDPPKDFPLFARRILAAGNAPAPADGGSDAAAIASSSRWDAVRELFLPDATFVHPFFVVKGVDAVCGIYEMWVRQNWVLRVEFNAIAFDEGTRTLFVDLTQHFHHKFRHLLVPLAPNGAANARLVTTMKLRRKGGKWFVERQEDWYRTDRIAEAVSGIHTLPLLLVQGFLLAFVLPVLLRIHDALIAPIRAAIPEQLAEWADWMSGKRSAVRREWDGTAAEMERAVGTVGSKERDARNRV
ncbi:hypothetical protein DFJ74DRAFT_714442 [Hyaloraphidium curvatum]|nr:hypothetical protein DFJ74DRAFT_714442 [Hyaloraphidium curvatum]